MRTRLLLLIVSIALLGAACATESSTDSSGADATTSSVAQDATASDDSTTEDSTAPEPSTTSTAVEGEQPTDTEAPSAPKPEGPAAPDFTLALGESGTESFTLSQEVMPVFMVFWAEW